MQQERGRPSWRPLSFSSLGVSKSLDRRTSILLHCTSALLAQSASRQALEALQCPLLPQSGHRNLLRAGFIMPRDRALRAGIWIWDASRVRGFVTLLARVEARIETIEIAAHRSLFAVLTLSRYIHRSTLRSCGRLCCWHAGEFTTGFFYAWRCDRGKLFLGLRSVVWF